MSQDNRTLEIRITLSDPSLPAQVVGGTSVPRAASLAAEDVLDAGGPAGIQAPERNADPADASSGGEAPIDAGPPALQ